MLKHIFFAAQTIGPAERIEGARNYMSRASMSAEDILTIAAAGFIAAGFIILIAAAYIKQKRKMK